MEMGILTCKIFGLPTARSPCMILESVGHPVKYIFINIVSKLARVKIIIMID